MYKLMIIDDETIALSYLTKLVRQHFGNYFKISAFTDAAQALHYFQEAPADIVLTDIMMPSMDGLELIRQMQSFTNQFIPIVFSGYRDFDYAKKAISLGVIYYLEKPIHHEELQQCLTAAARKLTDDHRISYSVSYIKEDVELFFSHLMKEPMTADAVAASLKSLELPFSLEQSSGLILRIHILSKPDFYQYEKDALSNVWENLLRMLLTPSYLCTINRTLEYYDLILFGTDFTEDGAKELYHHTEELLKFEINCQVLSRFDSLTELNTKPLEAVMSDVPSDINKPNTLHQSILQAVAYMEQHFSEDLTREQVAESVFMSTGYFSRLFKQETGVSFLDYLTEIRMKRAIELLNTNMKIKDIGKAVGYSTQNRFNINFRNYTSYSPNEYRKKVFKIYF